VRAALPKGSALVEFARYSPVDARTKSKSAPSYLAYILPAEGPPRHVELGDAGAIDGVARELRKAFGKQAGVDYRSSARKFDELVMDATCAQIAWQCQADIHLARR
jgi:hypothetical protein